MHARRAACGRMAASRQGADEDRDVGVETACAAHCASRLPTPVGLSIGPLSAVPTKTAALVPLPTSGEGSLSSVETEAETRRFVAELGFCSLSVWNSWTLDSDHSEARAAFSSI